MTLITRLTDEHNAVVQYAQESHHKDGFLDGMKKAIEIVKNHNVWISVDDELPNPEQEINYLDDNFEPKNFYLVQLKSGFIDTVYYATICSDCEYINVFISCTVNVRENRYFVQERGFDDYNIDEVKYWQYLPQPPRG